MRRLFFACILALLLISRAALVAQDPSSDSPLVFSEGLSIQLPATWKTTTFSPDIPLSSKKGFENLKVLNFLLRARPVDGNRAAALTIIRDESFGAHQVGPIIQQDMRVRLGEFAAQKGFRIDGFNLTGFTDAPDNAVLGEAIGISPEGERRIFACLAINRISGPSFRCFWEYDESDTSGLRDFNAMLGSMAFNGARVAEALASRSPLTPVAQVDPIVPPVSTTAPAPPAVEEWPTATTSPTPESAPGLPSPETGELVSTYRNALVVVEGTKGVGSGFLCQLNGQPSLVTNIHVLADNPQPRFTAMNGASVTVGVSFLGVERDIFKAAIPDGSTMLDVMTDVDATAKIGDAIVVLGNAEGAGVIRPFEGRIVGLGPNLVEVDAPFVQGNSGSPIVHAATGKVIGIATYLVTRKVDDSNGGEVKTVVRRFGYRLDNVKSWEPVNWPLFYAQSAQAAKIEATGEEFIKLFTDARKGKLSAGNYRYAGISRPLFDLENASRGNSRMSAADLASLRRKFLGDLRAATMSDITAFNSRTAYDYFRTQVAEQKKLREEIYGMLTRVLESGR